MKTCLFLNNLLQLSLWLMIFMAAGICAQESSAGNVPPLPGEKPVDFTSHSDVPPHPLNVETENDIPPLSPPVLFVKPKPAEVMVDSAEPKADVSAKTTEKTTTLRGTAKKPAADDADGFISTIGTLPEQNDVVVPVSGSHDTMSDMPEQLPELESAAHRSTVSSSVKKAATIETPAIRRGVRIDPVDDIPIDDLPDIVVTDNTAAVKTTKPETDAAEKKGLKAAPIDDSIIAAPGISVEDLPGIEPLQNTDITADPAGAAASSEMSLDDTDAVKKKAQEIEDETSITAPIPDIPFIPSAAPAGDSADASLPEIPEVVIPPAEDAPVKKTVSDIPPINGELPEIE